MDNLRAAGPIPQGFVALQSKVPTFFFVAPRLLEEFLAALPARDLQRALRMVPSERENWIGAGWSHASGWGRWNLSEPREMRISISAWRRKGSSGSVPSGVVAANFSRAGQPSEVFVMVRKQGTGLMGHPASGWNGLHGILLTAAAVVHSIWNHICAASSDILSGSGTDAEEAAVGGRRDNLDDFDAAGAVRYAGSGGPP